jgi:hypothetical protein
MVYTAAQCKESFKYSRDLSFDCLRRHAAVERGNDYFWNVDWRKQVHRHLHGAGDSNDQDNQAKDNNEVGISNGEARHLLTVLRLAELHHVRLNDLAIAELIQLTDCHTFAGLEAA